MKENQKIRPVLERIREQEITWEGASMADGRKSKIWCIGIATASTLSLLIKLHSPKVIVELGTSSGLSALVMAQAATTKAKIYTIEADPQKVVMAKQNFSDADQEDTISLISGDIGDAIRKNLLPESIDFLFIDADKKNYSLYYSLLKDKLVRGSIIVADNVLSHEKELTEFIASMFEDPMLNTVIWPHEAGLLVSKVVA